MQQQPQLTPISVSVEQATTITSIGRSKLYELMADNSIKSVNVGRRRLILVSSLHDYLNSLTTQNDEVSHG